MVCQTVICVELCFGKCVAGEALLREVQEVPVSSSAVRDTMGSISAVFKSPERSEYVQPQECEAPGKGSAPGNVASPGSVSSSSNVMSSEGYGSLSAGHVCSPGNIVSPPSQSDWKATSNQVALFGKNIERVPGVEYPHHPPILAGRQRLVSFSPFR